MVISKDLLQKHASVVLVQRVVIVNRGHYVRARPSDDNETRFNMRDLVAHGNCRNVGSSSKKGKWNPENEVHVEMCDPPDCDETKGRTFICDTLEHNSIRDFEQNPIWEAIGVVPEFW